MKYETGIFNTYQHFEVSQWSTYSPAQNPSVSLLEVILLKKYLTINFVENTLRIPPANNFFPVSSYKNSMKYT